MDGRITQAARLSSARLAHAPRRRRAEAVVGTTGVRLPAASKSGGSTSSTTSHGGGSKRRRGDFDNISFFAPHTDGDDELDGGFGAGDAEFLSTSGFFADDLALPGRTERSRPRASITLVEEGATATTTTTARTHSTNSGVDQDDDDGGLSISFSTGSEVARALVPHQPVPTHERAPDAEAEVPRDDPRRSYTDDADADTEAPTDNNNNNGSRRTTDAWQFERRAAVIDQVGEEGIERVRQAAIKRDYGRLVADPSTAQEEEYQVDHDDDALRWRATKHPQYAELDQVLGEPQPRSECFGCTCGDKNMSAVSSEKLDKMRQLYVDNRHEMTPIALGQLLERYYEKYVRAEANDPLVRRLGERELPEWRAATIVDHFMNHRSEPQAKLAKRLDQVGAMVDHVYNHGVYRTPINCRDPKPEDIKLNEKYARIFMTGIQMELRLHACEPKTMLGFNENVALEGQARSFVRSKHTMVNTIRKRKPFDDQPPAPL